MAPRALLLVNPKARQAAGTHGNIGDLLRAAGLDVLEPRADDGSASANLIRKHRGQVDLVVIGGGDGTLNSAAGGLVEAGLPLGVLPLGTANDLARTLGLPTDLAAACQVIATGHTKRIDLGIVNGQHFFNAAHLGLSVAIAEEVTKEAKSRWGIFAYLATGIATWRRTRPFHVLIRVDAAVHRAKCVQVTVGNGRHYGGGLIVAADAAIDDGLLNVYCMEVDRWWHVAKLLPALRAGTVGASARVNVWTGREVDVSTRKPRPVNTDGEVTTATPAKFRVLPQALSVFVPATV